MVRNSSVFAQASAVLASVTAGLLVFGSVAPAHAQAVPRITAPVDASAMVALPGQVHPWARAEFDRGAAPSDMRGHLLLMLKRSPNQETDLRQLIASQKDPKSPNYRKWLTPEQFGKRFGAADADLQTISSYLSSQGMRVNRIYGSHSAIDVEATTGQIQSAFRTSIHAYSVAGKTFYANSSAPEIPAALRSVVSGVASINNFRITGGSGAGTQAAFDPATHQLHPLYTNNGTSPATYGVSPADLRTIYDIPAASAQGNGGQNVRVGIIGDSDINVAYINNYSTTFGLGAKPPIVVVDGNDPGSNDDAYIAYKQIELVNAVAPNAQVYYYTSATTDYDQGLFFALFRAVDDNNVQVLLNGFQECEAGLGANDMPFVSGLAEQAAAQGITVVAAAGNSGAAGCAVPGASGSLGGAANAINGYAESGYLTAVGGTDFYYGAIAMSAYWGSNNGYSSATSYIPEQVWNDSYSTNGNSNAVANNSVQLAGGGGVSTVGWDGVSTPEPMQSYQLSNSNANQIGGGYARVIPDVSFFAGSGANNSEGFNNTAYMFCMKSTDCSSNGQFTYSGGTEASSAVFAGAVALLVNQYNSGSAFGLGNINPELYAELGSKIASHDITIGSNELACSSGANCSNGNMTGYTAGAGYDAASGLGSFDITSFVTNYKPVNTTASNVALTVIDPATGAAPVCVSGGVTTPNCTIHGTKLQYTVNATPTAATGDVALAISSPLASESGQDIITLSGGTGSLTWSLIPGGSYNIYARYAGDGTYAPSVSAPYPITVKPETCKMWLDGHNVNIGSSTNIPYGTPVNITVEPYSGSTPTNVSIPSGSVQVTDNGAALTAVPINSEGAATFSSNLLGIGSHSINLTYPGDASFGSCSIGPFLANITAAGTVTVLNPSSAALNGGSTTLTAEVEAIPLTVNGTTYPSTGVPPTGTVTFKDGSGNTLGTPTTLVSGFDAGGNAMGAASITLTSVPAGGTVTAVYNGNAKYGVSQSAAASITTSSQSVLGLSANTTASFSITDTYGVSNGIYPNQDSLTLHISVPDGSACITAFGICWIPVNLPSSSGSVSILANGVTIATGITLDKNGNATYTLPQRNGYLALPSGQVQLTVVFNGYTLAGSIFGFPVTWVTLGSSSTTQSITISSDATSGDFSLQSDTTVNQASPLLASSGVTQAAYTLRLTSLYNYTGAVNLSCAVTGYSVSGVRSAPPNGLACGLSNGAVSLSSGFGNSTLTVQAASGYAIASSTTPTTPASHWWIAAGGTTLACLFLFGLPGERRKWQSMLAASVLMVVSFGITGCGANLGGSSQASQQVTSKLGGGASSNANGGGTAVPAGTYTVTVTGTTTLSNGTKIVHTLPVEVLVGATN